MQKAEQKTGTKLDMAFEGISACLHFLKIPEPPKIASSSADQAFNIGVYGELFTFKP